LAEIYPNSRFGLGTWLSVLECMVYDLLRGLEQLLPSVYVSHALSRFQLFLSSFQDSPIFHLQVTFAAMQEGQQRVYNPIKLVESLALRTAEQQDAQEWVYSM
jgi:hypothetical protein